MKCTRRIFGLMSCLMVSTTFISPIAVEASSDRCSFSDAQMNTVGKIVQLFDMHAEDKIVKKMFSQRDYQDLARQLTNEFVDELRSVEEYCNGTSYDWTAVTSMEDLKDALVDYLTSLKQLKKFSMTHVGDDLIGEEMKRVQGFLLNQFVDQIDTDSFFYQDGDIDLSFVMNSDEVQMDMHITAGGEGVSDVLGTTVDKAVKIAIEMDMVADGETVSISGEMDGQLRVVDGMLYVKLMDNDLSFDNSTAQMSDIQDIREFLDKVKLIEGKWIELPVDGTSVASVAPFAVLGSAANFKEIVYNVLEKPVMMTYYVEGDTYYGGLNPLVCAHGVLFGSATDCVHDWQESYAESNGKGFVFMRENLGIYTMGITDRFTDEKIPSEMSDLNGADLVTWNNQKLLSIDIPFGEMGVFTYKEGYMNLDLTVPEFGGDIVIKMAGTLISDKVKLAGVIRSSEFDLDMSIDVSENRDALSQMISFDFRGKQPHTPSLSFDLDAETSMVEVPAVDVKAPAAHEIVTLGALLD